MSRLVSIFTGQFADIPLKELVRMIKSYGYEGVELCCWGDHMDVARGAKDPAYLAEQKKIVEDAGLVISALSCHLPGQLVCDPNDDERSDTFAPAELAGDPEAKRAWGIRQLKDSAICAKRLGLKVVNGFTGSSIWHLLYSFPPVTPAQIEAGYKDFADKFNDILDVYDENGIKFALEVHPTEIAFDIVTAKRALEAIGFRKSFGFNFDPSHLQWQGVDPVRFLMEFSDRIYNVHMKDCAVTLDGRSGILSSYLNFGENGRGWDFRSLGHGDVDFEAIIRALNHIDYQGPLAVEWEDAMMDRAYGATESCQFVKNLDFPKSDRVFDEAFGS